MRIYTNNLSSGVMLAEYVTEAESAHLTPFIAVGSRLASVSA